MKSFCTVQENIHPKENYTLGIQHTTLEGE